MTLEDKVMALIKEAMKAKDHVRLTTLRAIKAAILEAKTASGASGVISEKEELKLIQKMAKQRKDSMTIFKEQNREDLASKEAQELEILTEFLPEQMDESDLKKVISDLIAEIGASGPMDMGKVMGQAQKKLAGKADGGVIAKIVKQILNA